MWVVNTEEIEAPSVTRPDRGLLLLVSNPESVWPSGAGRASLPSPAASVAVLVRDRVCRWWIFLVLRWCSPSDRRGDAEIRYERALCFRIDTVVLGTD